MTEKRAELGDTLWIERAVRARGLYARYGKRIFDGVGAAAGLIVLSPVFVGVALAIAISSFSTRQRGAGFFSQRRIGRNGRPFSLIKFRTMAHTADGGGPAITVAGDARITSLGAVLRRWKVDELPQLWNVLKGEMSLVGPRPELESFVREYTLEQRRVLGVRPGITDPASIAYRDEEELLAKQEDARGWYRRVVLPHKLALNLDYIEDISFSGDVALIAKTMRAVFSHHGRQVRTGRSTAPGGSAVSRGPGSAK